MRKSIFVLALLAFCSSSPQTAQPISPKVVLPVSIVLAVAGSIATTYCYKQEKHIIEELEKLAIDAEEIENLIIKATPSEIAALKKLMEQKKSRYQKGKWICGGVTLASLVAAIISGVKTYQLSKQTATPIPFHRDPIEEEERRRQQEQERQARLQQKIALEQEIQAAAELLTNKRAQANEINLQLQNEIENIKQNLQAKTEQYNGIQIPNERPDGVNHE